MNRDTTDIAGVRVLHDVDLTSRNTLGLAARTDLLVEVHRIDAIAPALARFGRPRAVLGAGSNVILSENIEGPVYRMLGAGFECHEAGDDKAIVAVAAGLQWDAVVDQCIGAGAFGVENLALIPGLVGAAPIQNIGAYGVELSSFVHAVEAFDLNSGELIELPAASCGFGYRDSRFKQAPGRWLITRLLLELRRRFEPELGYLGLSDELARNSAAEPTAQEVADAVRRVRRRKLPDPLAVPNAGSFFKNPVIPLTEAMALRAQHHEMPVHPLANGEAKLSAAWLIEACGLKGEFLGGAAVSERHALVVINSGGANARDVLDLQQLVETRVRERFGIALEREPVLIGCTNASA